MYLDIRTSPTMVKNFVRRGSTVCSLPYRCDLEDGRHARTSARRANDPTICIFHSITILFASWEEGGGGGGGGAVLICLFGFFVLFCFCFCFVLLFFSPKYTTRNSSAFL